MLVVYTLLTWGKDQDPHVSVHATQTHGEAALLAWTRKQREQGRKIEVITEGTATVASAGDDDGNPHAFCKLERQKFV